MVLCENTTLPLPIRSASPHRVPIHFSICKDKCNRAMSAVFLVPNSFPVWTGLTVGLCHDCPKQSNPVRGTADWSGAALSIIIIITLKDLHWQREGSQEGLWATAVQRAPPVDRLNKQGRALSKCGGLCTLSTDAYEDKRLIIVSL